MTAAAIGLLLFTSVTAFAQNTPRTIRYQGLLTSIYNDPLPGGRYAVTFSLYRESSGGTPFWTETHTLSVVNGGCEAILGSINPLIAPFTEQYYLGIAIADGTEAEPRLALTTVVSALHASVADTAMSIRSTTTGVVRSVNGREGDVVVRGAGGTTVTTSNDGIVVSSPAGGIASVTASDPSLTLSPVAAETTDVTVASGGVTTAKLADGSVTAAKLADGNVTTSKLADGSVTTAKLADGAGTTPKLADGSVTTTKLADDGVTTVKLADSSITTRKLADGSVTIAKLADGSVTTAKLADGSVTAAKLADGSVMTSKLADGSVTTPKLVDRAATTRTFADGSVTTEKLSPTVGISGTYGDSMHVAVVDIDDKGRVIRVEERLIAGTEPGGAAGGDLTGTYPNPSIRDGAIVTKHFPDGAVVTVKIADGAVTTAKLATGAVTTLKIEDGSVTTAKLADGAVTTVKIADNTVTSRKMSPSGVIAGAYTDSMQVRRLTVDASGRITRVDTLTIRGVTPGGPAGGDLAGTYPNPQIAPGAITTSKLADGAVTTAKLADGNVTTTKLADSSVTMPKIADGNVTTPKIADGNATTSKIADGNVTTSKIADGAVTTEKLADSSVTTPKLADGSVTTPKIADGAVTTPKMAPTGVVPGTYADSTHVARITVDRSGRITSAQPVLITNVEPGGPAGGDLTGTYPNPQIAPNAVTTAKLANGSVTASKLAPGSVTTQKIQDDAVTSQKLSPTGVVPSTYGDSTHVGHIAVDATGRITSAQPVLIRSVEPGGPAGGDLTSTYPNPQLRDGIVGTPDIADGAVTAAKLADGSVTTAKLADGSVTTAKLADGSVTTAKLADGSVTTAKLADGSVMTAKLRDSSVTTPILADDAVTSQKMLPTGVLSGTYGDSLRTGQVTIDRAGRITQAQNVTIRGVEPGGPAGGDLAGTYPNPALATTAGNNIVTAINASSSVLDIAHGGTNANTRSGALNNLLPAQAGHAGEFLSTNGTDVLWKSVGDTVGTSAAFTGQVAAYWPTTKSVSPTSAVWDSAGSYLSIGTGARLLKAPISVNGQAAKLALRSSGGSMTGYSSNDVHTRLVTASDAITVSYGHLQNGLFSPTMRVSGMASGAEPRLRIYGTASDSTLAGRAQAHLDLHSTNVSDPTAGQRIRFHQSNQYWGTLNYAASSTMGNGTFTTMSLNVIYNVIENQGALILAGTPANTSIAPVAGGFMLRTNGTTNKLQISENGGAFFDLFTNDTYMRLGPPVPDTVMDRSNYLFNINFQPMAGAGYSAGINSISTGVGDVDATGLTLEAIPSGTGRAVAMQINGGDVYFYGGSTLPSLNIGNSRVFSGSNTQSPGQIRLGPTGASTLNTGNTMAGRKVGGRAANNGTNYIGQNILNNSPMLTTNAIAIGTDIAPLDSTANHVTSVLIGAGVSPRGSGPRNTFVGAGSGGDSSSSTGHNDGVGIGARAAAGMRFANSYVALGTDALRTAQRATSTTAVGDSAGVDLLLGAENTYLGAYSGSGHTGGDRNTFIGARTTTTTPNLTGSMAIGWKAQVDTNNAIVLGSIAGVNGATSNTNVGIGVTRPRARLHVNGPVRLGTGSVIAPSIFRQTSTVDAPNVVSRGHVLVNVAAPGAQVGQRVLLSPSADLPDGIMVTARVSAADVVTIEFKNVFNAPADPPQVDFFITVM
ncbi:MAG: hypothetical protein BGO89_07065 [Candidatus Kapaibacterium thiocyanatum]|uniref:Peptidase S74 domain-containing protein n=1 Tax=Candidatus Kapaibacterium thiocyanatum TaxID=1895771 RepID=A0A1M3KZF3_9BACT|nr:MAG: hypothetical protein BGO89_07065 ['Candidatus Kapabacteria' thiocyanatum]